MATGAWLPTLVRDLGVKVRVQAGRGYSFTVATEQPAEHAVYLPFQRIACTPYQGRFRIAGTMEFRGPDEPLQSRRIQAIVNQARNLMTGVDLDNRQDEWVGSRPVTPDGLPIVGATRAPGVFVAGDVRQGSIKRVAGAVGDGSMSVQLVHQYLGTLA